MRGRRTGISSTAVFFVIAVCLAMPLSVSADTGPKPFVQIDITGAPENEFYVTLLSKEPVSGPASVWDGMSERDDYGPDEEDKLAWDKFAAFADNDGYYYLQRLDKVTSGSYTWGYYPPDDFKLLIYFPASDTFAESGKYSRYAFSSYFTADLSGVDMTVGGVPSFSLERSYSYTGEILLLAARVLLTAGIETALALPFGFKSRYRLRLIVIVNLITQAGLNIALNLAVYRGGAMDAVPLYILCELLVFAAEAIVYCLTFNRGGQEHAEKWRIVLYALAANAASFIAGGLLMYAGEAFLDLS